MGYRFVSEESQSTSSESLSELDEFDIWNSSPDPRRTSSGSRAVEIKKGLIPGTGRSMPVKVPTGKRVMMMEDDDEEDRVPPHEVVARRARSGRVASFSVYEGLGRTLKGRDLNRVRNAVWDKIGFQD